MLVIVSSVCLLFAGCALLYQADERRSAYATLKGSKPMRYGARASALILAAISLILLAPVQGWERGIPIWLGILSSVFVIGLFIAAHRPALHAPLGVAAGAIGVIAALGSAL